MSLAPLNTLRVTSQTTLDELKAFQEGIGKDDAKLRGHVNKDGSITLKAVDRDSSFFSKMFGVSKKRRDAARSALTMVMTNSGAVDRKPTGSLQSLINADRAHSPRSSALKTIVTFAQAQNTSTSEAVDRTPIQGDHKSELAKRDFPTLEGKNLSHRSLDLHLMHALETVDFGPLSDTQVHELASGIRTNIHSQLVKDGPLSKNESAMLGVSDIKGYVTKAFNEIAPGVQSADTRDAIARISKEVADQLSEKLLGTKHVDDNTFAIGNETFSMVRTLGEGGFGKAVLYRCESTGREVVLKVPTGVSKDDKQEDIDKRNHDFKTEIDMHTKLNDESGMAYPHILQFEGAVRLPGGSFATVTEACTSGDMKGVFDKLKQAVTDGVLTPEQALAAQLTLIRDMADGQQVVASTGFSHRDVKLQNVFVDSHGNGKVADFGESAFSPAFSLTNQKIIKNPVWLAPENTVGAKKVEEMDAKVQQSKISHLKSKIEVFNGLVGTGGALANQGMNPIQGTLTVSNADHMMNLMLKEIAKAPGQTDLIKAFVNDLTGESARQFQAAIDNGKNLLAAETLIDGQASDVWSFGAALVTGMFGMDKSINAKRFNSQSEKAVLDYFNTKPVDPGNGGPLIQPPEAMLPGSFLNADFQMKENGTATGDADLDDLINQCLRRDPDDRPSFTEVLNHPVFRKDGIGDTETRNLIAALGGKPAKTNDEIKQLATQMTV